jgi:hypothetical protein
MEIEFLARDQTDLVGYGQPSNLGRAVAASSAATMILKPTRSWKPSHDLRNGHHQHSLPRGLSALLPAKTLSTAHGSPNIRQHP